MNNEIVRVKGGYDVAKGLAEAKKHLAYYEEGLFIDTAARIIDAMKVSGVRRSQLARRLNVSPAYITKVLRGHANLSLESLAKLAFALGLKWECILVPASAKIGLFSLTDESGSAVVRTVETATLLETGGVPEQEEYDQDAHIEEDRRELRIPA